eukprot:gene23603-9133_t
MRARRIRRIPTGAGLAGAMPSLWSRPDAFPPPCCHCWDSVLKEPPKSRNRSFGCNENRNARRGDSFEAAQAVVLPQMDAARRELLSATRDCEKHIFFGKDVVNHIFAFCELQHATAENPELMAPRQNSSKWQSKGQKRKTKPEIKTHPDLSFWATPWTEILDQSLSIEKATEPKAPTKQGDRALTTGVPSDPRKDGARKETVPAHQRINTTGSRLPKAPGAPANAPTTRPAAAQPDNRPPGTRSSDCNIVSRLRKRVEADAQRTGAIIAGARNSRDSRRSCDDVQIVEIPASPRPSGNSTDVHRHMDHPREDSSMCNMVDSGDCNVGAVCSYAVHEADTEASSNHTSQSTLDISSKAVSFQDAKLPGTRSALPPSGPVQLSTSGEGILRPKRLDYKHGVGVLADTVSSRSKRVVVTTTVTTETTSAASRQTGRRSPQQVPTEEVYEILEVDEEHDEDKERDLPPGPGCDSWDSAITLNNYAKPDAASGARLQKAAAAAKPSPPQETDETTEEEEEETEEVSEEATVRSPDEPAAWQLLQREEEQRRLAQLRMFKSLGISAERDAKTQDRCSTSSGLANSDSSPSITTSVELGPLGLPWDNNLSEAAPSVSYEARPFLFRLIKNVIGTAVGTAVMAAGMTFAAAAVNTGLDELEHPTQGTAASKSMKPLGKARSKSFTYGRSSPPPSAMMLGRG